MSGIIVRGVMCMSLEQRKANKAHKMKKRFIFRSIILILMLAAIVYALVANFNKDKSIYRAGDQAPDFKLEQINANNELESIQLSDLKGKGVMLNFWATYCKPCEAEMPFMEKLYPEYKEKGIEIVAVNLDVNTLVVDRFIDKYDLTFPILPDHKEQVMDLYKVGQLPSTFFIDENGVIVDKVDGALTLENLEEQFQKILPKK